MAEHAVYRFEIQNMTPKTLPMKRLQSYLSHLVEIFGNYEDIHLLRVDEGSATPCIFAGRNVAPKVDRRIIAINSGYGTKKAREALARINDLLWDDNTSAVLRSPYGGMVLEFPGINETKQTPLGPISENVSIQGELFQIGGRGEDISAHVRNDSQEFRFTVSREQGRKLSEYLFKPVRVDGEGKWLRHENGKWRLIGFSFRKFMPLVSSDLNHAVASLRDLGKELRVQAGNFTIDQED